MMWYSDCNFYVQCILKENKVEIIMIRVNKIKNIPRLYSTMWGWLHEFYLAIHFYLCPIFYKVLITNIIPKFSLVFLLPLLLNTCFIPLTPHMSLYWSSLPIAKLS